MKRMVLVAGLLAALSCPTEAGSPSEPQRNILTWPLPDTLSPQGRAAAEAAAFTTLPDPPPSIDAIRQMVDGMQSAMGQHLQELYRVRVEEKVMGGVPVRIVLPEGLAGIEGSPLLLNLHGGGGKLDSGSLTETIPIAALTKLPVVAVLYRLAPENPYPARLNDALSVYHVLARTHGSQHIGIYGTSAGAVLSAQLVAKLAKLGEPMPGSLGFFAGTADQKRAGDSEAWMPMPSGPLALEKDFGVPLDDPVLSPIYGDLSDFPPTLLVTSTRDMALSGTVNFGRALLKQGVNAQLVVFDGLPHAFWAYMPAVPETEEANTIMANFLARHLRR